MTQSQLRKDTESYWNKTNHERSDWILQVCDTSRREAEAIGRFPGLDPWHHLPVQRSEHARSPGHRGSGWSSTVSGKHLHLYLFISLSVHLFISSRYSMNIHLDQTGHAWCLRWRPTDWLIRDRRTVGLCWGSWVAAAPTFTKENVKFSLWWRRGRWWGRKDLDV